MRVLHIVSQLSTGGAETLLMNLLRTEKNRTMQFDFLQITLIEGFYEKEAISFGSNVYKIEPLRKSGIKKFIEDIDKIIQENGPFDVIHSHVDHLSGIFMYVGKKNDINVRISHCHNTSIEGFERDFKKKLELYFLKYLINKYSTNFIACGLEAKKLLFDKNKDILVVNNAINVDKFNCHENDIRELKNELNISNQIIIGHVGRFVEQKNYKYLIDIFSDFCEHNDALLLLIGDGPLKKEIIEYSIRKGVYNNCLFLGQRNDINILMGVMDVLLLPSLFEGFPLTLIESQAAGLPAVISNNISKEVDLGMGLITFISLGSTEWANEIRKALYKENNLIFEERKKILSSKKYDVSSLLNTLKQIYGEQNEY